MGDCALLGLWIIISTERYIGSHGENILGEDFV